MDNFYLTYFNNNNWLESGISMKADDYSPGRKGHTENECPLHSSERSILSQLNAAQTLSHYISKIQLNIIRI
jgi:hypothetical protein